MQDQLIAAAIALSISVPTSGQCPARPGSHRNDTIAMTTGLAVNPDGAIQSYTVGDHGFTYISNGLNLWERGRQVGCSTKENGSRCRSAFQQAEARGFAAGTAEFCVYAMEVEPISPGQQLTHCTRDRWVAGNGKGRLKKGAMLPTITGTSAQAYVSMTTLRHIKGGSTVYLDSATVPVLVYPTSRPELSGSVAWVSYQGRSTFAIMGDSGPSFGEGSVALHQLLRSGALKSQPVGPIGPQARCGPAEAALQPPFLSRPDRAEDVCGRSGPHGSADIRAYNGIRGGVDTVILTQVRLPMSGNRINTEVTPATLEKAAMDAGYDRGKLRALTQCLRTPG